MKSRVLGLVFPMSEHAIADAEHALHALQFLGRQRLVDALGGEVENSVPPPAMTAHRSPAELADQRHLSSASALVAPQPA